MKHARTDDQTDVCALIRVRDNRMNVACYPVLLLLRLEFSDLTLVNSRA